MYHVTFDGETNYGIVLQSIVFYIILYRVYRRISILFKLSILMDLSIQSL